MTGQEQRTKSGQALRRSPPSVERPWNCPKSAQISLNQSSRKLNPLNGSIVKITGSAPHPVSFS